MTNSDGSITNSGNTTALNNLVTDWYYASIVDSEGCSVSDSIFIDEPGELDIDLTIENPLCYGVASGYVEVDSVYNATGDYTQISYFWNPNPSGIPNGIGATWINKLGDGTYLVTIQDENGCSKEFTYTIVSPPELVFTEIEFEPAYCRTQGYQSGNGVVSAAAGGGTPDYTYLWTNLETGASTNNTTWGGLNPGSYQMTATDDNGCTLVQVIVLDSVNPIASFNVISDDFESTLEGTAVVCVEFENTSQYFANPNNPNADTTFFWDLGYFGTSIPWELTDTTESMDTCYYSEGIYEVCLAVINKNACKDTACVEIIVHDPPSLETPNIFTPGANGGAGDGINDVFTFQYKQTAITDENFECIIVDRWGQTVYTFNSIYGGWDGNNSKGKPVSDGVYFYTYKAVSTNGTEFKGQGNIHLVREK